MSAQHTPGPWYIGEDGWVKACGADGIEWEVAIPVECCGYGPSPDYDTKTNARLIAAAPDLLDALEDALVFVREEAAWCDTSRLSALIDLRDRFEALIAKARGEQA